MEATSPFGQTVSQADTVFIRVVRATNLQLSAGISAPAGALDDTVSFSQHFVFAAVVRNLGAAVITGPASLRLDTGPLLQLEDSPEQNFVIDDSVFWQIRVDSSSQGARMLRQISQRQSERMRLIEHRAMEADEGVSGYHLQIQQLEGEIRQLSGELEQLVSEDSLRVTYAQVPNDINTGKTTLQQNTSVSQESGDPGGTGDSDRIYRDSGHRQYRSDLYRVRECKLLRESAEFTGHLTISHYELRESGFQ